MCQCKKVKIHTQCRDDSIVVELKQSENCLNIVVDEKCINILHVCEAYPLSIKENNNKSECRFMSFETTFVTKIGID